MSLPGNEHVSHEREYEEQEAGQAPATEEHGAEPATAQDKAASSIPQDTRSLPAPLAEPFPHPAHLTHRVTLPDAPATRPCTPHDPPPPPFRPFFALVHHPPTGEVHHPHVHYIFSDDDDAEPLTSATLSAIEDASVRAGSDDMETAQERIAIIDMAADGETVAETWSLSADWQCLSVSVGQAPSWGSSDGDIASEQAAPKRLMLRVSGREVAPARMENVRVELAALEGLVKGFGERMDELQGVLGAGGEVEWAEEVQGDTTLR